MFKVGCGKGEMIGVRTMFWQWYLRGLEKIWGILCLLVCLYTPSQFFLLCPHSLTPQLIKDGKIRSAVLSAESSIFWPWHAEMTLKSESPAEDTSRKRESSLTPLKLWFGALTFSSLLFYSHQLPSQTLNSLIKLKQRKKWNLINRKFFFFFFFCLLFPSFHHFVECVQNYMSLFNYTQMQV